MVKIKEIAKAAGVSVSTVSNVLNGRKNVGEETRKQVLALCKEMNYYPKSAGSKTRDARNKTILFNFSDFDRGFYLRIIKGVSEYVNDNGYDLLICTNKSCEKFMRSNLTAGAIILDEKISNELLDSVADSNYPVVTLDRTTSNPYIKSLVVNNYDSMCELVTETIGRGYKRFGFVGGLEHTADHQERLAGFLDTLKTFYIPFSQRNYFSGDYREKSGQRAAKIYMLSKDMPQIIICANDNMAIGVIKEFRKNGIRVPEDVAVTGFDNCDLAETLGLTSVSIPNYERGYLAAQFLIESMKGNNDCESFKIATKVRWRSSVADQI